MLFSERNDKNHYMVWLKISMPLDLLSMSQVVIVAWRRRGLLTMLFGMSSFNSSKWWFQYYSPVFMLVTMWWRDWMWQWRNIVWSNSGSFVFHVFALRAWYIVAHTARNFVQLLFSYRSQSWFPPSLKAFIWKW